MMFSKPLLFFLLLLSLSTFAQTPYGNDWINFSQKYYKLKISRDGLYRITQNQLQAVGIPVSQINPKNIQLFNKGIEVPLIVSGEGDGTFDSADFIEFYAEHNDGNLDKPLYTNPSDQPHDFYSLYTDTAAYFLTWTTSTPGKRYIDFSATSNGLTAETYFMHTAVSYFTDGGYYPGEYILAETSLSEYTSGEGILGRLFYPGAPQDRAVSTPHLFTSGSPAITGEAYVAGRSNAASSSANNHHLQLLSSSDGSSFTVKKDVLFSGYGVTRSTFNLNPSEIGQTTIIRFSSVNDLGVATDYQAPGYVKITYPRQYNLQGASSLKFTLKGLQSGANSLIRFSNSTLNNPIFLDITNGKRVIGINASGNTEAVIPGAGTDKEIFLYNDGDFQSANIEEVKFTNYLTSGSGKNFLIVTHSSLLTKAEEYATYRTQAGYNTLLTTTQQLYDQFFYGIHHPLAIRNFCNYLISKASTKPEYLLLLGKGKSHFSLRNEFEKDLVPSIGNPPSDNMLTSGLNGTNWEPAIATGRIPAKTPEEVEIYLNKLKTYEQQPDALWRKNIIHVSGGSHLYENTQWTTYQNNFFAEASKESFGGKAINFQKNVTEPVTDNLKGKITAKINEGAALLSFFGHGSSQATEINFGEPATLQNQNKLLVYMINGCNAGNPFTETSLGEQMIFQPDKAAIGWLATTDEGVASYLGNFSTLFYRNSFKTNYGKSIAQNIKNAIKAYQNVNDILNRTHSRQYLWQGDPAIKFYSPLKPDYFIENKDLYLYPSNVSAASDSFAVAIIAKNLGKAINTPLSISIKHTLPNNSQITYPTKTFNSIYNSDTLLFYIKKDNNNLGGNNKFFVTIESNKSIDELNETNNTAEFNYIMPSNSVNTLFPINNSIVSETPIQLKAQSSNLLTQSGEFIFEIDTVKTFNSAWKKSGTIQNASILSWNAPFTPDNNKVYYWRVRLNTTETANLWQESSFTFIDKSATGWSQSHSYQFNDFLFKGIHLDMSTNKFEFDNTTFITDVQTKGDDVTTGEERAYRSTPGGRLGYGDTEFTGLDIIALNPKTLKTFTYPSTFNLEGFYRYSGEFHFNINNPIELDSLIQYIGNIPQDYYVVGHNGRNISLKDLSPAAKAALQSLGLLEFASVKAGEPYMFWGRKGSAPGSAIEKTADPNSAIPARSQIIKFQKEYYFPFTQGSFSSTLVGPAKSWKSLEYEFEKENTDLMAVNIYGINNDGKESLLFQNTAASNSIDLSSIDAVQYPYLTYKVSLTDNTDRTPAQLKHWKVLYEAYPEATINTGLKNNFYSNSINEGDTVIWQLAYQNISDIKTDSISAYYTLTKSDRSTSTNFIKTFRPLVKGDSIHVNLKLPTKGLVGANSVKIELSPKNQQDLYTFNNYLNQYFTVVKDNKAPLVNVLFDGRSIINNELVSPVPVININVLDENPFFIMNDTSAVEISVKGKDDNEFKREYFSSNRLNFTAASNTAKNQASIEYRPERFKDGSYTLKIRSKDITGNYNETNDYQIDFEVVNESSITNFYPYPNPFTTKMKFVFTLTGDKVPDKMKIQILTATGKIVREILKEELGNLRVGNNISEFTWDGTDQFGDRLANGVYFYQVLIVNNDNSEIKHRVTAGDKFFKKNFGKIYLMR